MKSEWKTIRADEFCSLVTDGTHDSPKPQAAGRKLITSKHLKGYYLDFESANWISSEDYEKVIARSSVEQWDILYSMIGTIGNVYLEKNPVVDYACKNVGIFKFGGNCNKAYWMYYYLKSPQAMEFIKAHLRGTTQLYVPLATLREMPVPVPDEEERNKIVAILRTLDDKIQCSIKINDNLEQQAKLIYDYWFTQFDFPDENGKPYCSSGGKMVWDEQLKRNIPENWNVVPLLKLVSWESNSQPPKSEFVYEPKEGYVRFIQNRDYDSDTHITYIPRTKNLSIVDRFDILMDKYGDAGAVRYGIEGAFNVALGKICVHNPNYREYIRSFLGSDGIYKFLHNSCMASTRASLSEANLAILNVVVPDEKIILDYENFLKKIRVSILKNKDETVELINLRDWLLPMLMNGQATIAD